MKEQGGRGRRGRESKMAESSGIFTHGTDFMNDLLIVDLMESGGSVK